MEKFEQGKSESNKKKLTNNKKIREDGEKSRGREIWENQIFPREKICGRGGGVGAGLATADLPTAPNHTGLQTPGGGSNNAQS
jgi:hypothetical protein